MATGSFVWGANGEAVDTDQLSSRRKVAEAMMRQASDTSPIKSAWQGWNRVAQGIFGGMALAEEDAADKRAAAMYQNLPGLGGGQVAAATPAGDVTTPAAPAAFPGGPTSVNTAPGKIYANDEPSPLDPPSGIDRDRLARTVIAEAGNQGPIGMNAVASVARNRTVAGSYGGDTPSGVVMAPNQFEPWNTSAGRAKMAAISQTSPEYIAATRAIDSAYSGNDPTNGAVNFYSPKTQAALGRSAPSWDNGTGVNIGDHRFFGGAPVDPAASPYQVAGQPVGAPEPTPTIATSAAAPASLQQGAVAPGVQTVANAMAQQPPASSAPISPSVQTVANAMRSPIQIPAQVQPQIRAMLANPRTRADGLKLYQQYAAPKDQWVGEQDANTGSYYQRNLLTGERRVLEKSDVLPQAAVDQKIAIAQASKPETKIHVGDGEDAFSKEGAKLQAQRFNELVGEGQGAKQLMADMSTLVDLGRQIKTGKGAEATALFGPYAETLKIPVKGLSEIQAYESIVNRVAPSLRVKGSGAQSDMELRNFLKSIPSLGNTPEGNEMTVAVMQGLTQNKILASEIASKALTKEITRKEAEEQLRNLPDPMEPYRQFKKTRTTVDSLMQKYGGQ